MQFSRREFTKAILAAAAFGLVETSTVAKVFGQTKRSITWLAAQTASSEGNWTNLKIEGRLPKDLSGALFRIAPGLSESFGTRFNHLFDGDAFLTAWRFENGKASLRARFLQTPQRLEEQVAKQMLYGEFGTHAPPSSFEKKYGGKNHPSVNVIEWRGKLLGLSEGGLPSVINPENFDYEGETDFGGVVPKFLTFTAHPRIDPKTGDLFAFGFEKRPPGNLRIFHIERNNGKATELYKSPMDGFYMVHDSLLTENYFILLIPPMEYDVRAMMSGRNMSEALRFMENKPTRLLAFPRDNKSGREQPVQIELPPQIMFHFGNAFETTNGEIVFEVISGNDKTLLEKLRVWKKNDFETDSSSVKTWEDLRRVTVSLKKKTAVSTEKLAENVEFPRYDFRLTGQKSRFLYAAENGYGTDAKIVRADLQKTSLLKADAGKTRTFGEPVFAPNTSSVNEEHGWILAQGYDAERNETFLEIRDAQTLDFAARVWASGQHFPLGFHGNFYPSS